MDRSQMASFFDRLVSEVYGGRPVPPAEGGLLFRTVCERCREQGSLFWTESRLHDLARELGYWPWSVSQIEAALRQDALLDLHVGNEITVDSEEPRTAVMAGRPNGDRGKGQAR